MKITKTSKLLSFLMALVIALGIMPAMSFADEKIEGFNVTVTGYEVGKKIGDISITIDNPNVLIGSVEWSVPDGKGGLDTLTDTDIIEADIQHIFKMYVKPAKGYTLKGIPDKGYYSEYVKVNGEKAYLFDTNIGTSARLLHYMPELEGTDTKIVIDSAEVKTNIEAGIKVSDVVLSVPSDAHCTVKLEQISVFITSSKLKIMTNNDVFEAGKKYSAYFKVVPDKGYKLSTEFWATLDGNPSFSNAASLGYRNCDFTLTDSTELTKIESFNVTVTGYEVGKKIGDISITIDNPNVLIESVEWSVPNEKGGWDTLTDTDIVKADILYAPEIYVKPAKGYTLKGIPDKGYYSEYVKVNGEKAYLFDTNIGTSARVLHYMPELEGTDTKIAIDTAEVTSNIKIGRKVSDVVLSVPSDAHYTANVEEIFVYISNNEINDMADDDVFEAGKKYGIKFRVVPDKGYKLSTTFWASLDGKGTYSQIANSGYRRCSFTLTDSTELTKIEGFNVTVTGYELGKKIGDIGVTIDNPNVLIESVKWQKKTSSGVWVYLNNNDVVEADTEYAKEMYVKPAEGYTLEGIKENSSKVKVNGKKADAFDNNVGTRARVYHYMPELEGTDISKVISSAEVTASNLAIGKKVSDVVLSVPTDANYTARIDYFYYYDDVNDTYPHLSGEDVFQAGVKYTIRFVVEAKTGYELSESVQVTLNGKNTNRYGNKTLRQYSFTLTDSTVPEDKIIDYIEAWGVDVPAAGKTPDFTAVIPTGKNYKLNSVSWKDPVTKKDMTGKFEAGKTYELSVEVKANDGYAFSPVGQIKGKLNKRNDTAISVSPEGKFAMMIVKYTVPETAGKTRVDEIEADVYRRPFVGGKSTDVRIGAKADMPYEIQGDYVMAWSVGDDYSAAKGMYGDYFEAGKTYWANVKVDIKDTDKYYFGNTLNIEISGHDGIAKYTVNPEGKYAEIIIKFIPDGAINLVEILGVTAPVDGKKPDISCKIPFYADYSLISGAHTIGGIPYEQGWYDNHAFRIPDNTRFKAGEKYTFVAIVEADEGYQFVYTPALNAELNGNDAWVQGGGRYAVVMYTFTAKKPESPEKPHDNNNHEHEEETVYYTIRVDQNPHGTITPKGYIKVAEGNNKTFTIKPEAGYKVVNVKVDGKSVMNRVKNNTYTFYFIDMDHRIEAEFEKIDKTDVKPETSVKPDKVVPETGR